MTDDPLRCRDTRRDGVRALGLRGLDHVEVSDDQLRLTVHLIGRWPAGYAGRDLAPHVVIEGGRVIRTVAVRAARATNPADPEAEGRLDITLANAGDFSPYAVRLARLDDAGRPSAEPLPEFDPRYSRVAFSFKVGCKSDADCRPAAGCDEPPAASPRLDYLAKDYASFRRVLLDRLATVMPDWRDRSPADLGVTIAELLAYAGDHLSYLQDAVATEAYLGTARRRVSVRRHLRLVDERLHEGCNARAWLHLTLAAGTALDLPRDAVAFAPRHAPGVVFEPLAPAARSYRLTRADLKYPAALAARLRDAQGPAAAFAWAQLSRPVKRALAGLGDTPPGDRLLGRLLDDLNAALGRAAFPAAPAAGLGRGWRNRAALEAAFPAEVARAAHPARPLALRAAFNAIPFHLWGDEPCVLPRGATSATLADAWDPAAAGPPLLRARALQDLSPGDVLVLEEVKGPRTADDADADPTRRHPVRLTRVEFAIDPVGPQPVALVEWAPADALPFPLCLAVIGPPPDCRFVRGVTVARGNVVPADHGATVSTTPTELGVVGLVASAATCRGVGRADDVTKQAAPFAPTLQESGLTWAAPFDDTRPAATALSQDAREAGPAVRVWSVPPNADGDGPAFAPDPAAFGPKPKAGRRPAAAWVRQCAARAPAAAAADLLRHWEPRADLIGSSPDDAHVVLETDDEGRAHLRFGDGEHGLRPEAGEAFFARPRVGTGPAGNLPAGVKWAAYWRDEGAAVAGIEAARNPFPAGGGTDPEDARGATAAGRTIGRGELVRAVTPDDYAALVMRHFGDRVQRAVADFRDLGTWVEVRVALDPLGGYDVPDAFRAEVRATLDRYRLIGHEVSVAPARYVPLRVRLHVCVLPGYYQAHVVTALKAVLGSGRGGAFHPDALTFGQPVLFSGLLARAAGVPGVADVQPVEFRRRTDPAAATAANLARGFIPIRPTEVARMDDDANDAGAGELVLDLEGGR